MVPPTPQQQQRRAAFERLIGFAAPFLDLVLAAGERVSRIVSPEDDYIPIRSPAEAFELGRGRSAPPEASSRREIAD